MGCPFLRDKLNGTTKCPVHASSQERLQLLNTVYFDAQNRLPELEDIENFRKHHLFFDHLDLDTYRHVADPTGDTAFNNLREIINKEVFYSKSFNILETMETLAKQPDQPSVYSEFLRSVYTTPDWVDFNKIEKAQIWYLSLSVTPALILTSSSLVSSYGASNGSQVLIETGRLNDDVARRLFESGLFVHQILKSKSSLMVGGDGHISCLQVRLLHSAIRRFLLNREKKWDSESLGLPINAEDMAGTICVFCVTLIENLRRMGLQVSEEEKNNYQHMWRWIGYLLGIPLELLPECYEAQRALSLTILKRQWKPNDNSKVLAKKLFQDISVTKTWRYFCFTNGFWHGLSRILMKDRAADQLELMKYQELSTYSKLVIKFLLITSVMWNRMLIWIPGLRLVSAKFHRILWEIFLRIGLGRLKLKSIDFKMKQY